MEGLWRLMIAVVDAAAMIVAGAALLAVLIAGVEMVLDIIDEMKQ